MTKKDELKVFISSKETICGECKDELDQHAWISLDKKKGPICLTCADLDHLEFLSSGDAALTRRSKKYSKLYALVLKWIRRRKRYERQGLLVEGAAIEKAEQDCSSDEKEREDKRKIAAKKRAELDTQYIEQFSNTIREYYPYCPKNREIIIAKHACRKYSGRVGRCAAAKEFNEKAVKLAIQAHIRHSETDYDELLIKGYQRWEARELVKNKVSNILYFWEKGKNFSHSSVYH